MSEKKELGELIQRYKEEYDQKLKALERKATHKYTMKMGFSAVKRFYSFTAYMKDFEKFWKVKPFESK